MKATLILENGTVFCGKSIGASGECICEMVFNTSMVGYQEILTDPSYAGQGVVMSYPLIGNYGVNSEDNESEHTWCSAFVVRHLSPNGSNFRNEGTLDAFLKQNNVVGIEGVDTRAITRILRNQGTMNGMITCAEHFNIDEVLEKLKAYRVEGAVERVTCSETKVLKPEGETKHRVALMDFGVKANIIDCLLRRGCEVTVYPAHTAADEILNGGHDGVMLSNGPGDPADCADIVAQVRKLYDSELPMFGTGLGHQLMALAVGAKTYKMTFGHRGVNQPVRDLTVNRGFISSQNHGYAVEAGSIPASEAEVSHVNVNDGSVEGLNYKRAKCFSVQFQPEANLSSTQKEYLFDRFVEYMGGDR